LHADRQATEKKRPQVEKNLLPPAVRLKNEKRPFPLRTKNCQHNPNNRLTGKAPYTRKPQRPTARQEESTFLAKFTIVPIPIWLELEKDRPVRPHSGFPFCNSDRLLRDRDRRFRIALPPQASLLSTNGRSSSVRCVAVSSAGCRRRMLAEEVIPDLVRRQPVRSNIEKAAELVLRVRKLAERVGLDLPDSLAGYRELVSNLFQGMIALHADAEAHAHDALLARR
jgi:hypothetical protein